MESEEMIRDGVLRVELRWVWGSEHISAIGGV